eukprot:TRINITY_DN9_c0_g1_i1.p1 TRINITY_DN9_c0_g1~~TRINITY_DN9_c0_g1_i1.p1  ORF type:complete len:214 (-),score=53.55 TRINITY_DN9_c0_g1_i1:109-693(-)
MKSFALVLVLAFVAAVAAQSSPPVWPSDFSATIILTTSQNPYPFFLRWFYSQTLNQERFDGVIEHEGQRYFAERLFDFNQDNETDVFFGNGGQSVFCFTDSINYPLVKPDFSSFNFFGQSLVDEEVANLYIYAPQGALMQYWTTQAGEPKRFDYANSTSNFNVAYDFIEFDAGLQDPTLFTIPAAIRSVCRPRE